MALQAVLQDFLLTLQTKMIVQINTDIVYVAEDVKNS